jgi:replicative DNA helicase
MAQTINAQNVATLPKRFANATDVAGRVPPHNIEAEESLLGAMLLSRDAIASAVEIVSSVDFYKPAHSNIFDAITSLYSQGEPADPVTVAESLRRDGHLDQVGGAAALISLQSNTPAIGNAARYARIVEELALLRKLIGVASEIAEMGYGLPDDVSEAIDHAESMVFEVASKRVTDTLTPLRELLSASLDRLEALYERGETITGVPTGFVDLDEQLAGLQPSNLVIVGARPAMGKCVAFDTPIIDPKTGEVLTVEELFSKKDDYDVALLSLRDDHRVYRTSPSHFVDDGLKPVFKVRTGMGREIGTTMSHPFLTPTGWRPLADLAPGALVGIPRSLAVFGNDSMPEHEIALLAYACGDAGVTQNTPRLFGITGTVLEDVRSQVAAIQSDLTHDVVVGVHDTYRVEVPAGHRNHFLDLMWQHGLVGVSAQERRVPKAIYRLPREQLAFFLNRLFSSGGSTYWFEDQDAEIHTYVRFHCMSKQMAHAVQHLMLRFGCNMSLRRTVINYQGEKQLGYELLLTNYDEIIYFVDQIGSLAHHPELEAIAARLLAGRHTIDLTSEIDIDPQSHSWPRLLKTRGSRSWREFAHEIGASGEDLHPSRTSTTVLEGNALESWRRSDILWDEVISIDYDGEQQVYDFTVPDDHNFVAADVYVHNTSFALNVVAHASMEAKLPVLLFSLEMSHLEITQRLLCSEARVDATRMRNGRLLESDWPKITHAIGRLGEAPVYIDDNPNVTIMDIRAKARRMKSREGLGLVVIDYLQLLTGRNSAESRQVEVSELSRGLKILARELEVPVLALSQLSRNLEQRSDKRPILADLRESGSLEQDSDVVMFLYRDEIYNPESTDRGTAEILVAKHRNGPTGVTKLAFLDHYTRFANMARRTNP